MKKTVDYFKVDTITKKSLFQAKIITVYYSYYNFVKIHFSIDFFPNFIKNFNIILEKLNSVSIYSFALIPHHNFSEFLLIFIDFLNFNFKNLRSVPILKFQGRFELDKKKLWILKFVECRFRFDFESPGLDIKNIIKFNYFSHCCIGLFISIFAKLILLIR